jgi:hypothetical protein
VKAADHAKIAVDLLAPDELLDKGQRVAPFLHDPGCSLKPMAPHNFGMAWLDAGRDLTAIARAAPPSRILGVENNGVPSTARCLKRCMQPSIARANHNDICTRRQICFR